MKRAMVLLAVMTMMSGCAMSTISRVERNEVFGQPVEQLVTTVCHPSGYELTTVQTFVAGEQGARLIDSNAAGGPGIGYAIGVGVTAGTGAAATGGLLNVWAAHELRPDQTTVQQNGGGAQTSVGVAAVSDSSSYADADATSNAVSQNYNVNQMSQGQFQGQQQVQAQQQQQQQKVQPVIPQPKPPCPTKPTKPPTPPAQNQRQNVNLH